MMQGVKIVTMRGETYVFTARPDSPPVDTKALDENGQWLLVHRGPTRLGLFPMRNIEAVLPATDIDGEVAS